jgi:hypothetical protein
VVTATNDQIVVDPISRLLKVCAWCVAPVRLVELSRAYRCTHSLCPACRAKLEQETA